VALYGGGGENSPIMRHSTTLILLVGVLALGFYIIQIDQDRSTTADRERPGHVIWDLDPDQINRINISQPSHQLVFVRSAAGWQMQTPWNSVADPDIVGGLVNRFSRLKADRRLEPESEASLDLYGLTEPPSSIRVELSDGDFHEIHFGNQTVIGKKRYAEVEGETGIFVIDPTLPDWASRPALGWRDRYAFRFDPYDVRSFVLTQGEHEIHFDRPSADWMITQPTDFPADNNRIKEFLESLSRLQIKSFLEEEAPSLEAYGLDQPQGSVKIRMRSSTEELVWIWGGPVEGAEGEIACMLEGRSGKVWGVDAAITRQLTQGLDGFWQRRVVWPQSFQIQKLHINYDHREISLNKEETEDWGRVEGFIKQIGLLEASQIINEPKELKHYGLEEPRGELTLTLAAPAERKWTLYLGSARARAEVYVKYEEYPDVLVVDRALSELIKQEVKFWFKR
jgi:hypothetical protein